MSKRYNIPLNGYVCGGWVYYSHCKEQYLRKSGKWMYFFHNKAFAARICEEVVGKNICIQAKYSNAEKGVCCFYLNSDDMDGHKRLLSYFLEHDLIQKTKAGRLYNISFKLDSQTRAGLYGKDFQAAIKLDQFVNLNTGEFII